MSKIETLTTITSGYLSNEQISSNFDKITTAMSNTVSRDGSSPNTITANIDMNSKQLINLVAPTSDLMAATKKYVDDATSVAIIAAAVASTAADVVSTHADVVLTHADVVLTHADVVTTAADVVTASQWATKITGQVASTDYSSKAYAIGGTGVTGTIGAAKEWATSASLPDGVLKSAKSYAADAAAAVSSLNLPTIGGATDTGKTMHVNAAGTGYDLISTMGTSGYVLTSEIGRAHV